MFSKAVVACARKYGWFVQRIESHETGRGIPDIYAVSADGRAYWIELKRVHASARNVVQIPWRPGQQGWLHTVTRRRQRAITLACFDDCILVIEHKKLYSDNKVAVNACIRAYSVAEIFR